MALGTEGQPRCWAPEIRGAALARGMMGVILPAVPVRFAIGGKQKQGVLAAHAPRIPVTCFLKCFYQTFCTDTQTLAKLLTGPFLFIVMFLPHKQLPCFTPEFASSPLLWS